MAVLEPRRTLGITAEEAGFTKVAVYWEETDADGNENGVYPAFGALLTSDAECTLVSTSDHFCTMTGSSPLPTAGAAAARETGDDSAIHGDGATIDGP